MKHHQRVSAACELLVALLAVYSLVVASVGSLSQIIQMMLGGAVLGLLFAVGGWRRLAYRNWLAYRQLWQRQQPQVAAGVPAPPDDHSL